MDLTILFIFLSFIGICTIIVFLRTCYKEKDTINISGLSNDQKLYLQDLIDKMRYDNQINNKWEALRKSSANIYYV